MTATLDKPQIRGKSKSAQMRKYGFFPGCVAKESCKELFNSTMLSFYTFSCHSLRHLIGGNLDCFSCSMAGGPRHAAWRGVTKLNEHHMFWAWVSMISVGLTDLYIRLVASGALKDFRLL